jgi:hypothetical protein
MAARQTTPEQDQRLQILSRLGRRGFLGGPA